MNALPEQLILRLKEKKKLLQTHNPKHKKIKTALVIGGAAMRGAYAAGVVVALKELGLEDVFDMITAASSGVVSASYFLSGDGDIAPKVFYEDLATKKFINILRINPRKILGFAYVNDVFRNKNPINQDHIYKSRSALYVGVTDPDTGKETYLDVKQDRIDVVSAIFASSSIPLLQSKPIVINGKNYLDGMIGCGIPISLALQYNCTDILVIENDPIGKPSMVNIPFADFLFALYKFPVTPAARKAIADKKRRYKETVGQIYDAQKRGVHIGIIAPEKIKVNPFSINGKLLKRTAEEGKQKTLSLFSQL